MTKRLLKTLRENKALIGLIVILTLSLVVAYWWTSREYTGPTGGVGQPNKNTVILTGWQLQNQDQIELGAVISDKQQQALSQELSRILVQERGEFDYVNAEIKPPLESLYDKTLGTDQTIFYLDIINQSLRYKIFLNHNDDSVMIQKQH